MEKIWCFLSALVFTGMTIGIGVASEGNRDHPSQVMIEQHDQDGDGKISKEEFPGPEEHFIRIDQDGDGFINENEARKAPRPEGQDGRVPGKFQEDDADGDGVVSRTEFSGPSDHFDRLDLNGDGSIEKSEARQGPPGRLQQRQGAQ